jgi:two-component system, NarL family, nitrate/nitrite response regulator NarL
MPRLLRTAVFGSNALCREGLTRILERAGYWIIASAALVADAPSDVLESPEQLLVIIHASDDPNSAIDQLEHLKEMHASWRVAVIADRYDSVAIVSTFQAGANAYFIAAESCEALVKSLEVVTLGETILPARFLRALMSSECSRAEDDTLGTRLNGNGAMEVPLLGDDMRELSNREKCILRYLMEGDSNKMIARKINVAEATVKVHIKAILRKIRVHNRTQAAIWALSHAAGMASEQSLADHIPHHCADSLGVNECK